MLNKANLFFVNCCHRSTWILQSQLQSPTSRYIFWYLWLKLPLEMTSLLGLWGCCTCTGPTAPEPEPEEGASASIKEAFRSYQSKTRTELAEDVIEPSLNLNGWTIREGQKFVMLEIEKEKEKLGPGNRSFEGWSRIDNLRSGGGGFGCWMESRPSLESHQCWRRHCGSQ